MEWLKTKISTSDEAWPQKIVFAITGRHLLALNTKIKLQLSWRSGAVYEFHTCFNSLDLPEIQVMQEDFFVALELSLHHHGYNIA